MTLAPTPAETKLVRLSGTIRNYKVTRGSASFVITERGRNAMGVVAIAAALAGQGAQAVSVASNTSNTEEEADFVEFELDGKLVKGWLWRSPLNEGDEVEVAAEAGPSYFNAYGAFRPMDRTVALYPHCSRGTRSHSLNALKLWALVASALVIAGIAISVTLLERNLFEFFFKEILPLFAIIMYGFCAIVTFSLVQQLMPFARLAEKVFATLNFSEPSNLDLVRSSKRNRRSGDSVEFGTFYFRLSPPTSRS